MDTNKKIIVGVVALVIVVGFFLLNSPADEQAVTSTGDNIEKQAYDTEVEKKTMSDSMPDDTMEADMMKNDMDESAVVDAVPDARALVAGIYTDYTAEAVASSEAEHIVLNFSATWCPSCRTLDKNISASTDDIPAGVEIYKVDYDTYTDLRKKYGITTQHSFVLIDAEGNMIKKWSGGSTLDDVLGNL